MREMPEITKSAYSSSSSSIEPSSSQIGWKGNMGISRNVQQFQKEQFHEQPTHAFLAIEPADCLPVAEGEVEDMRRIVQVFIADTTEDIPLENGLLYEGEPKFTDLTDEELFFEIGMKDLLDSHNVIREATLDKKATKESGRDVYLEPARIRDLRMVVVDIAVF
jgi:hypothetical protein